MITPLFLALLLAPLSLAMIVWEVNVWSTWPYYPPRILVALVIADGIMVVVGTLLTLALAVKIGATLTPPPGVTLTPVPGLP